MPRPKIIKFPTKNVVAPPTQDCPVEPFITVEQLAELPQVKPNTIWECSRRRNTNAIPHYPVTRKVVYFRWSEVVDWIKGQRQAA
jgi:hypothetical protein